MSEDYLWDRSGEGDAFARSLERRLAPLDEADEIVDSLDLDAGPSERDEAVVVQLRVPVAEAPGSPPAARSWPWLAAAVILLGLSAAVLVGERSERLAAPSSIVEVGGAGDSSGRVVITAPRREVHVELRPAHAELAACALELDPGDSLALRVRIVDGALELGRTDGGASRVATCARTALAELDVATLGAAELTLEFHGPKAQP